MVTPTASLEFPGGAIDFSMQADGISPLKWFAEDDTGQEFRHGELDRRERTVSLSRVATLTLVWPAGSDPTFSSASWNEAEQRTGILPSVYARDPGAPSGPASIDVTLQLPSPPPVLRVPRSTGRYR